MSYSYHTSTLYAPKTFPLDIFTIQLCACLLGANRFFVLSLDRFDLVDYFKLDSKKYENSQKFFYYFFTIFFLFFCIYLQFIYFYLLIFVIFFYFYFIIFIIFIIFFIFFISNNFFIIFFFFF